MAAAFFFPGQGSQFPGMAHDLAAASPAAREVLSEAQDVLHLDARAIMGSPGGDNEFLFSRTDTAQRALAVAELAVAACLAERGILPAACAGHSAGEYPALACAGVLSRADCLALVAARGKAMQEALDKMRAESGEGAPGMAAATGLPPEKVVSLVAEWNAGNAGRPLFAANFNAPEQTAVSGSAKALEGAAAFFKAAGARRFVRLPVAGPFHSPLMQEAAAAFAPALGAVQFNNPALPFFSNVTGREEKSGGEIRALAARQMCEPVRWTEIEAAVSEKCFAEGGAVVEAGPGEVLQGLWRGFAGEAGVPACGAGTMSEIAAIADILER